MGYKAAILDWREICDDEGTLNTQSVNYLTKSEQAGTEYTPYIFAFVDGVNSIEVDSKSIKEKKQAIVKKLQLHNIAFAENQIFCYARLEDKRGTLDFAKEGVKLVCHDLKISEDDVLIIPKGSKITKKPPFIASQPSEVPPPYLRRPHVPAPHPEDRNWGINAPLIPKSTTIKRTYSRGAKAFIGGLVGLVLVGILAAVGVALYLFCPPVAMILTVVAASTLYTGLASAFAGFLGLSIITGGALIGGSRGTSKVERSEKGDITIEGSNVFDINDALRAANQTGTIGKRASQKITPKNLDDGQRIIDDFDSGAVELANASASASDNDDDHTSYLENKDQPSRRGMTMRSGTSMD